MSSGSDVTTAAESAPDRDDVCVSNYLAAAPRLVQDRPVDDRVLPGVDPAAIVQDAARTSAAVATVSPTSSSRLRRRSTAGDRPRPPL